MDVVPLDLITKVLNCSCGFGCGDFENLGIVKNCG